jgi:transcriptional regulator with XRE-family HTH domain
MSNKRVRLSDQVRAAVDASGMSRYRLCKMLEVSESTLSRFMAGTMGLSMDVLDHLADALNLNLAGNPTKPADRRRKAR